MRRHDLAASFAKERKQILQNGIFCSDGFGSLDEAQDRAEK